jgi:hypothetical protein
MDIPSSWQGLCQRHGTIFLGYHTEPLSEGIVLFKGMPLDSKTSALISPYQP